MGRETSAQGLLRKAYSPTLAVESFTISWIFRSFEKLWNSSNYTNFDQKNSLLEEGGYEKFLKNLGGYEKFSKILGGYEKF